MGVMPLIPLEITWNGNNQGGSLKRGVAIAMQSMYYLHNAATSALTTQSVWQTLAASLPLTLTSRAMLRDTRPGMPYSLGFSA
jgi:hypothetical protein